jgi:3-deoxy-7-phosphoheptulonate synthase
VALLDEYLTFCRLPLSLRGAQTVLDARKQVEAVVKGDDDRLLVVVG